MKWTPCDGGLDARLLSLVAAKKPSAVDLMVGLLEYLDADDGDYIVDQAFDHDS